MVCTVQFVITAANVGAGGESAKFWEKKKQKCNGTRIKLMMRIETDNDIWRVIYAQKFAEEKTRCYLQDDIFDTLNYRE